MTPEQIAEIGVSGKGYWLFDRNSTKYYPNEAILLDTGKLVHNWGKFPWSLSRVMAIYKWIPSHRS